ncbi:SNARE protein [Cordyceps militaris]|uniref:SNARE protein n=1 Tax=Cordyceps militaris TaxID=73501 RepID=A0A2H4S5I2_CORMI|nr:SNARE protein [Cordyceps militaris]
MARTLDSGRGKRTAEDIGPLSGDVIAAVVFSSLCLQKASAAAAAAMSESYERERQNNSRLDELSAKVSALRGVTIDIYDNARAQDVIDNTSETFSSMGTQMRGSAGRLTRMAASGNKVAILKLSAILIGVFIFLYYAVHMFL